MVENKDIKNQIPTEDSRFGFIVIGMNEALFGIVHGNNREVVTRFSVVLPKKRSCGGSRFIRLRRIRKEKRQNYVQNIFEIAVKCFIRDDIINVDGIILAHVAELNSELRQVDTIDSRIQANILQQVTICHESEIGFNQAIQLASETIGNTKFIKQKKVMSQFFDEVLKDSSLYCFGVENTLKELETGDLKILIIWENLNVMRFTLRNHKTEEVKFICVYCDQDKDINDDFELVEQIKLVDWLANNYISFGIELEIVKDSSQEGSQFVLGFDGIGGILRDKIDKQSDSMKKVLEQPNDDDIDDYSSFF